MRPYFLLITCLLTGILSGFAEKDRQARWQQRVDCEINARLYPSARLLKADITMHYYNNSPDVLQSIWLHVWPNAYKNRQTAYARQELKIGKSDFYFSTEEEKGSISKLQFACNGQVLKWRYDSANIDIIELMLDKPLQPHSDIVITTPFEVKLPFLFSRSGYNNGFFSITQWYPKPAVYDVNGWNKMPYLNIGEFYSEYGDYKVSITVPERYIVAATGNLQTHSELAFLDSMASGKKYAATFLQKQYDENTVRTITYTESNIHDFAWFADTAFQVNSSYVVLNGHDTVRTWLFKGRGKKYYYKGSVMPLINNSVMAYSQAVGMYPYKQCSVVIGPMEVADGMEYPGICICNKVNRGLIKHEIGHNWFYGILGSNERRYAWMDESINSFYQYKFDGWLRGDSLFYATLSSGMWQANYEALTAYLFSAGQGISQPLNLSSEAFTPLNYGSVVYGKGPLIFAYLQEELGDSVFAACVKYYFNTWKFRHPLPGDMQDCFEKVSRLKLDWFFVDLLNENYDIDIVSRNGKYIVKGSASLDSFLMTRQGTRPNHYGFLPETNYNNNGQRPAIISFHFPYHLPRYNKAANINVTPLAGFNYYDKLWVGALFFNRTIFRKKYEYFIMPAYGIGTKKLIGYGSINRMVLLKSKHAFRAEGGVQGQSFGLDILNQLNQYYRINPYFKVFFKHRGKVSDNYDKQLLLSFCHTGLRRLEYDAYKDSTGNIIRSTFPGSFFYNYVRAAYQFNYKDGLMRYGYKLTAEYGDNYRMHDPPNNYLKAWLNIYGQYNYAGKNKFIRSEVFAGSFLHKQGNITTQQFYLSANNGTTDYQYQEAMIGRSERFLVNDNILARQVIDANGNMRNVIPVSGTDKWMLAMNNEICFPGIIPLRLYADLGYFRSSTIQNGQLVYNKAELYVTAGVLLPLLRNTVEIFVPLYQSKQFVDIYQYQKFGIRDIIGFKLRLNSLHPFRKLDAIRTRIDDL